MRTWLDQDLFSHLCHWFVHFNKIRRLCLDEATHTIDVKHKLFGKKHIKVPKKGRTGEKREALMSSHGNRIY